MPTDHHRDLLDWSHAMVKMYELDTPEEQAVAANAAASAFRDYTLALIEERRRSPQRRSRDARSSRRASTAST